MKIRMAILAIICAFCMSVPFVSANTEDSIVYSTEKSGGKVDLKTLPADEQKVLEKRFAEIDKLFVKKAKAQSKLTKAKESGLAEEISTAQGEVDRLEIETSEMGLIDVKKLKEFKPEISALSSVGSDFVWDVFHFYKDTSTGKYVWEAQGMFDSGNDWASECFCSPYYQWYDLGGNEGFGLASLHKDINIYESAFWTLNSDNSTDVDRSGSLSTINARGAGWKWQDKVYANSPLIAPKEYDSNRRFGWLIFTFVSPAPIGQTISFHASTAHTWSTTSVNGVSVGGGGIGFSWANQGSNWEKPVSKPYTIS